MPDSGSVRTRRWLDRLRVKARLYDEVEAEMRRKSSLSRAEFDEAIARVRARLVDSTGSEE